MLVFFCLWIFVRCSWNILVFKEFYLQSGSGLCYQHSAGLYFSGVVGEGGSLRFLYVVLFMFTGGGWNIVYSWCGGTLFTVPPMINLRSLYEVLLICLLYGSNIHSLWWGGRLVSVYITLIILIWLVHAINIYIINKVFYIHCSIYLNLWYDYTLVIMDRWFFVSL